jgi:hypothetical protein
MVLQRKRWRFVVEDRLRALYHRLRAWHVRETADGAGDSAAA